MRRLMLVLMAALGAVALQVVAAGAPAATAMRSGGSVMHSSLTLSLDGTWLLAPDPENVGREAGWCEGPQPGAKPTPVPWIIQAVFPGAHGVAWYWREFEVPEAPEAGTRYLLRFWQVDYLADVWVNGVKVGSHEGGEDPFVLDVTGAVKPGAGNRAAVRVLNPTNEAIDGMALWQTPRRNKTYPYSPGSDYNYGGLTDSVELLVTPAVRVEDLVALPDPATGEIRVRVNLRNAGEEPVRGRLRVSVAPATSGETLDTAEVTQELGGGDTLVEARVRVANPRLWELNDPALYRVSARVQAEGSAMADEQSTRCGFRDFRFAEGAFRLNGRRLYLKCSHSGADTPVGVRVPYDRDLLRRDILNCKAMGFNMIRFIAGLPQRYQLDLCDEVGLLVYEENFASWCLGDSPQMAQRFDHSTAGMVRRDRNHPSIVMWGLLNETPSNPVFYRAVKDLGLVRDLDETRVVMLSSGSFDSHAGGSQAPGPPVWRPEDGMVPNATKNCREESLFFDGTTWPPQTFALHPGIGGEYSVVRWTAPAAAEVSLRATFHDIVVHGKARTDIHVLHNGEALFESFINLNGKGDTESFATTLKVEAGDTVDCVVGIGDDWPYGDTTALDLVITAPDGTTYDVTRDWTTEANPSGAWAYGWLPAGERPQVASFTPYAVGEAETRTTIGRLANPGSRHWEDVLADTHPYQPLPHNAGVINTLRTTGAGGHPLWLSEYGIGSALDLPRLARHYEQLGRTDCEDAVAYRHYLDLFMEDWERWHLEDSFASPEDYFNQCLEWHAALRLLGTNAIRANPQIIGHSMTGTHDQGLTGEGITASTFRDLKPGVTDALFDAWYPLRWCLFVEPVQVYRGRTARFEAVLANEDALAAGDYPVRFQVVGPNGERLYDQTQMVSIPDPNSHPAPPFAMPVLSVEVPMDGPEGTYRFVAAFQRGGAAAGGEVSFGVLDPAQMPQVSARVALWGDDAGLSGWLSEQGIAWEPFDPGAEITKRQVILVGNAAPGDVGAWSKLAQCIARGSTAIFLCPEVFRRGDDPVGWVPLTGKGALVDLPVWVYHKDDWAKRHPVFAGLPAGCILDHDVYREVIGSRGWSGQGALDEAIAGAINTGSGYSSGLTVGTYGLGAGRLVLNALRIRESLGQDPVAERLLRNLLNYAAVGAEMPPAPLPEGFDGTLRAMGYE